MSVISLPDSVLTRVPRGIPEPVIVCPTTTFVFAVSEMVVLVGVNVSAVPLGTSAIRALRGRKRKKKEEEEEEEDSQTREKGGLRCGASSCVPWKESTLCH